MGCTVSRTLSSKWNSEEAEEVSKSRRTKQQLLENIVIEVYDRSKTQHKLYYYLLFLIFFNLWFDCYLRYFRIL